MTAAKIPVAAVVGPTATGKTELGIQLCQRLGGEIVSCDSMQVYKGLPIGTAQPTAEELAAAPHHLIGFLDVEQPFSVSDYVDAAGQIIREISSRGKLPILVGGTGLYARSLLRGFSFEERGRDDALRQRLFQEAEDQGIDALYQRLERLDPKAAEEIHPHNVKRVIRALEYIQLCGEPFSAQAERSHSAQSPYQYVMLCLGYENRETLYRRIDARVDKMLEQGLLPEAQAFYSRCQQAGSIPTVSLEEAVEAIKRESRRYAKRQITWFKREEQVEFLPIDAFPSRQALLEEAVSLLGKWGVWKGGNACEQ